MPAAIALARRLAGQQLLDASWAIPVAFACGWLAIACANLARVRVQWTLGRAGGEGRAKLARRLAALGLCLAAAATISVVFYEILLRLEK